MMYENKNAYISMMISLVIHMGLYFIYLSISDIKADDMILLEDIEFIEIESDKIYSIVPEIPQQVPPKSVLDFVKMAFQILKKPVGPKDSESVQGWRELLFLTLEQMLHTEIRNPKDFEKMSKNYLKRIEDLEDVRRTLGSRIRKASILSLPSV